MRGRGSWLRHRHWFRWLCWCTLFWLAPFRLFRQDCWCRGRYWAAFIFFFFVFFKEGGGSTACARYKGSVARFNELRLEGRSRTDGVVNRVHLGVHRERLAAACLAIVAIVMRAIMIIARRYNLPTLDENSAKCKAHCALRRSVLTLREIKLVLRHVWVTDCYGNFLRNLSDVCRVVACDEQTLEQ